MKQSIWPALLFVAAFAYAGEPGASVEPKSVAADDTNVNYDDLVKAYKSLGSSFEKFDVRKLIGSWTLKAYVSGPKAQQAYLAEKFSEISLGANPLKPNDMDSVVWTTNLGMDKDAPVKYPLTMGKDTGFEGKGDKKPALVRRTNEWCRADKEAAVIICKDDRSEIYKEGVPPYTAHFRSNVHYRLYNRMMP